MGGFACFRTF